MYNHYISKRELISYEILETLYSIDKTTKKVKQKKWTDTVVKVDIITL